MARMSAAGVMLSSDPQRCKYCKYCINPHRQSIHQEVPGPEKAAEDIAPMGEASGKRPPLHLTLTAVCAGCDSLHLQYDGESDRCCHGGLLELLIRYSSMSLDCMHESRSIPYVYNTLTNPIHQIQDLTNLHDAFRRLPVSC